MAVLVYDNFELSDLEIPQDILTTNGVQVDIVGVEMRTVQPLMGLELSNTIEVDKLLPDVRPDDYDALLLPGGVNNSDKLRMVSAAKQWVLTYMQDNKLVAAIGHAPWLLVSADVVEERQLTSSYTLQDDIRNAGGEWTKQPLIVDGNLITNSGTADLTQFCRAILQWLNENQPDL